MKLLAPILIFLFFCNASFASNLELSTTTLDGKNFDLKTKRGKIVIINFWAQWCQNCRKEMLILDKIYHQYHARGLEIIGISIDPKKDLKKVEQVSTSVSYPNSMMLDAKKISFEEPNEIPISYVIGGDGMVLKKFSGAVEKEDFEEVLQLFFTSPKLLNNR